jgi:PBP1b-binding outer membrane lipoprotein LpoB
MKTWIVVVALALAGCQHKAKYVDPDAESKVEGTGIESRDVRTVAGQMAGDLLGCPAISSSQTPPRIAILDVENRSRFLIDAGIFTTLIQDTLVSDGAGKLAIVNRDLLDQIKKERAMKASGEVTDTGKLQALAGVDWFLEGSIESLSASDARAQTDYVVVRFQLTNADSGIVAWSNRYEMKKEGSWGVMYQ